MIKKTIYLICLFAAAEFLISCCPCNDIEDIEEYTHCNLQVKNLDNSGAEAIEVSESSVPKEAFGVSILLERSLYNCYRSSPKSLFTTAYAVKCNCPATIFAPLEQIENLNIVTLTDLNTEFPSGAIVNELFHVFNNGEFEALNSFIANYDHVTYDEFSNERKITALLMENVEIGDVQFEVTVSLSDGREFSAITDMITLL